MRSILAFAQSRTGLALRYLISVGLVTLFIAGIDWHALLASRGGFRGGPAVLGLLLAGATYSLHGWRWWLLLRIQRLPLGLHWSHCIAWVGQFYNSLLPGGLGGDAARAYYLCRDVPERKGDALASLAIDRALGLVVLLSLALAGLVMRLGDAGGDTGLRQAGWVIGGAAAAGFALGGFFLATDADRWPAALQRLIRPAGVAFTAGIQRQFRSNPRLLLTALAGSYLIWLIDIVSIWLLAQSLGLPLPFLETSLAVAVSYAAAVLPISIGGHGVRESALISVLVIFDLVPAAGPEADAALRLAVLSWSVHLVWSLAGGLVLLALPRLLPRTRRAPA